MHLLWRWRSYGGCTDEVGTMTVFSKVACFCHSNNMVNIFILRKLTKRTYSVFCDQGFCVYSLFSVNEQRWLWEVPTFAPSLCMVFTWVSLCYQLASYLPEVMHFKTSGFSVAIDCLQVTLAKNMAESDKKHDFAVLYLNYWMNFQSHTNKNNCLRWNASLLIRYDWHFLTDYTVALMHGHTVLRHSCPQVRASHNHPSVTNVYNKVSCTKSIIHRSWKVLLPISQNIS